MKLQSAFVPVCQEDLTVNDWDCLDIILITGDAYIDHPSFGVPLLSRYLIHHGFKVGIIAQPRTEADFIALGRPRLFFGISAGNMDSMVCHYTAQRKLRSEDAFSPNNQPGFRPDRATLVYCQKVKQLYKNICVVLGGIEASMRRIPHYDFWGDKVRNSLLIESKASILVYGHGERQILEIAQRLSEKQTIDDIPGTCIITKDQPNKAQALPEYKAISTPQSFYDMTHTFIENYQTKPLYYNHLDRFYVHYPPAEPLTTAELDEVYNQPFTREVHPMYKGKRFKAFEQIKYSVTSHRGCYGGCSFCAVGLHQGKTIQSRSAGSIIKEVEAISQKKYFRGTITDIGGPTANMYGTGCKTNLSQSCKKRSCLYPEICKNLNVSEKAYLTLLKAIRQKVNNVFVSSGIRHDLALKQTEFTQELCFFYTSGQIKLAPEHIASSTLHRMYKPKADKYLKFCDIYAGLCRKIDKKQYVIPYFIVGFPGTTTEDAMELHNYLYKNNIRIEQVQEFTPTPMTIATMMYYTGLDYETGEAIHVPKGREIREQKGLAQWFKGVRS